VPYSLFPITSMIELFGYCCPYGIVKVEIPNTLLANDNDNMIYVFCQQGEG